MTNVELADEIDQYLERHSQVGPGFGAVDFLKKASAALRQPSDKVLVPRDELETLQLIASSAIKTLSRDVQDWVQDMERVQAKAEAWLAAAKAEGHHE